MLVVLGEGSWSSLCNPPGINITCHTWWLLSSNLHPLGGHHGHHHNRGAVSRNYRLPTSDSSSFDSSLSSLPGIYPVRNHLARSASDNYCMQMRPYSHGGSGGNGHGGGAGGGGGGDRRRRNKRNGGGGGGGGGRECHRCSSPIGNQMDMLSLSRHQQVWSFSHHRYVSFPTKNAFECLTLFHFECFPLKMSKHQF